MSDSEAESLASSDGELDDIFQQPLTSTMIHLPPVEEMDSNVQIAWKLIQDTKIPIPKDEMEARFNVKAREFIRIMNDTNVPMLQRKNAAGNVAQSIMSIPDVWNQEMKAMAAEEDRKKKKAAREAKAHHDGPVRRSDRSSYVPGSYAEDAPRSSNKSKKSKDDDYEFSDQGSSGEEDSDYDDDDELDNFTKPVRKKPVRKKSAEENEEYAAGMVDGLTAQDLISLTSEDGVKDRYFEEMKKKMEKKKAPKTSKGGVNTTKHAAHAQRALDGKTRMSQMSSTLTESQKESRRVYEERVGKTLTFEELVRNNPLLVRFLRPFLSHSTSTRTGFDQIYPKKYPAEPRMDGAQNIIPGLIFDKIDLDSQKGFHYYNKKAQEFHDPPYPPSKAAFSGVHASFRLPLGEKERAGALATAEGIYDPRIAVLIKPIVAFDPSLFGGDKAFYVREFLAEHTRDPSKTEKWIRTVTSSGYDSESKYDVLLWRVKWMRDNGHVPTLEQDIWKTYLKYYKSNPEHLELTKDAPDILPSIDTAIDTAHSLMMKPPRDPEDDADFEWLESIDRDAYDEEKQNTLMSQLDVDMIKAIKKKPTGADAAKRKVQIQKEKEEKERKKEEKERKKEEAGGNRKRKQPMEVYTDAFTTSEGDVALPLPFVGDVADAGSASTSMAYADAGSASTSMVDVIDEAQESTDSIFKKTRYDDGISADGILDSLGMKDSEFDKDMDVFMNPGVNVDFFNDDI
jgi:hypothetical protein